MVAGIGTWRGEMRVQLVRLIAASEAVCSGGSRPRAASPEIAGVMDRATVGDMRITSFNVENLFARPTAMVSQESGLCDPQEGLGRAPEDL